MNLSKFYIFLYFLFCIVFGLRAFSALPPHSAVAQYEFTYHVTVPQQEAGVKSIKMWIPFPAENLEQKIVSHLISTNVPYQITKEDKFGNRMFFLSVNTQNTFPIQFEAVYKIERKEALSLGLDQLGRELHWSPAEFLNIEKNTPIRGVIAEIAEKETQGLTENSEKIKKMYQYIVKTMSYSKEGTGWGRGDAIWACSNKRGNCTDFHSLFIGMARSQKIPARFEIGFPIPPQGEGNVPGYHCWARAYSEKTGWVPVDASEAKKTGKMLEYFGHLPNNRIHFTTGRDLELNPKQAGEPLNFFIYPYMELDNKASENFKKEFFVKTLTKS